MDSRNLIKYTIPLRQLITLCNCVDYSTNNPLNELLGCYFEINTYIIGFLYSNILDIW